MLVEGGVIVTWMGNWLPIEGKAYGICLEIDSLGVFFIINYYRGIVIISNLFIKIHEP